MDREVDGAQSAQKTPVYDEEQKSTEIKVINKEAKQSQLTQITSDNV